MCCMSAMTKCFTTIHLRKGKMCSLSNPCSQAALAQLANAHIDTVPPTHCSSCPETQPQCVVVWGKPSIFETTIRCSTLQQCSDTLSECLFFFGSCMSSSLLLLLVLSVLVNLRSTASFLLSVTAPCTVCACVQRVQCVPAMCTMRACGVHNACMECAQCVRAACTMPACSVHTARVQCAQLVRACYMECARGKRCIESRADL